MAALTISWTRTCEYSARVDTSELRALIMPLRGSGQGSNMLRILDALDSGNASEYDARQLAYFLSNTETGRDYFGGMADDNPDMLAGTGAPEVTEIRAGR